MPHVSRSAPALAAVLAGVLFAGVPPALAQTTPAQGAATPQAALDGLDAAVKARDINAALGYLTPAGKKEMARTTVNDTLMFLAFLDPNDPMPGGPAPSADELKKRKEAYAAAKTEITAAFKPSGLDAAMGKPVLQKDTQAIVDKGLAKAEPVALVTALYAAVKKAAPALGMKDSAGPPVPLKLGPFASLKTEGTKASVKSGAKTIHLEQIDGKWFVDVPTPEPDMPQ